MEKTGSHRLFITGGLVKTADSVQELLASKSYDVNVETLFSLYEIYPHLSTDNVAPHTDFVPYPPNDKPYDPNELALILHSSGSTGLPKPILKTRKIMLQWTLAGEHYTGTVSK